MQKFVVDPTASYQHSRVIFLQSNKLISGYGHKKISQMCNVFLLEHCPRGTIFPKSCSFYGVHCCNASNEISFERTEKSLLHIKLVTCSYGWAVMVATLEYDWLQKHFLLLKFALLCLISMHKNVNCDVGTVKKKKTI